MDPWGRSKTSLSRLQINIGQKYALRRFIFCYDSGFYEPENRLLSCIDGFVKHQL